MLQRHPKQTQNCPPLIDPVRSQEASAPGRLQPHSLGTKQLSEENLAAYFGSLTCGTWEKSRKMSHVTVFGPSFRAKPTVPATKCPDASAMAFATDLMHVSVIVRKHRKFRDQCQLGYIPKLRVKGCGMGPIH